MGMRDRLAILPTVLIVLALGAPAAVATAGVSDSAVGTSANDTSPSVPATRPPTPVPDFALLQQEQPAPVVASRPRAPKFIPRKGKAIYIDRAHQRIYLYKDGYQIDTFLCATSRTIPPRGTYHVLMKRPASRSFNGAVRFFWQTVFMKSKRGNNVAFHSIPINSRGREIAPLGKPVSHGCVRVKYAKARFIYRWTDSKTPIIVRP